MRIMKKILHTAFLDDISELQIADWNYDNLYLKSCI